MKYFIFIFIITSFYNSSFANETCSRVATINYQKVLVDAGNNRRGEGLRFYLEKDPVSKKLLDDYQERNKPTILNASASTAGSIMVLAGLLQTNQSDGIQNSNTLIFSGSILIALSYLTTKTLQLNNENILQEAVEEYNKRNTPRIYFSPFKDNNGSTAIGFGLQQEF